MARTPEQDLVAVSTRALQIGLKIEGQALLEHARRAREARLDAATCAAGRDRAGAAQYERDMRREIEAARDLIKSIPELGTVRL